jgi:hypothetical protein
MAGVELSLGWKLYLENGERDQMPMTLRTLRPRVLLVGVMFAILATACGCAQTPTTAEAIIPPIPAGEARVWFYREFIPSESLNMTAVSMNGAPVGYSQLGGAFYRDVLPGQYYVAVDSFGTDFNQSANIALVPGQEAYIRIESLRSWSTYGERNSIGRDTFYARPILPQIARVEITRSTYEGGS